MKKLKPCYKYKAYNIPQKGIFCLSTDERNPETGTFEYYAEKIIIGETAQNYIEHLKPIPDFTKSNSGFVELLPLGPHKTRLSYWINGQTNLF
jgi:hypothetical protein